MIVNVRFEFDEETVRRIGLAAGHKGRKCTRHEAANWIWHWVGLGRNSLPALKVRTPKPAPAPKAAAAPKPAAGDICGRCGKPRGEHFVTGRYCQVSKTVRPGSAFLAGGGQ